MNRTGTLDAQGVAMPESVVHRWQVAGASVRGALHVREGIANQDAFATWTSDDAAVPVAIVTVADGHGGARHFRSAIGARLAVDKGLEVLREMASRFDAASDAERARITAVDVPLRIVKTWTDAAHAHLAAHPIGEDEWLALQVADGPDAVEMVRAEPLFAYGATLLAALVTRRCIVLVQLGDGDILVVDADGKAVRPVPSDARLVGHLTTSLCRTEAARDFRSAVLPLGRGDAPLLMLSTDGYANSFKDDGHFLRLSRDGARIDPHERYRCVRRPNAGDPRSRIDTRQRRRCHARAPLPGRRCARRTVRGRAARFRGSARGADEGSRSLAHARLDDRAAGGRGRDRVVGAPLAQGPGVDVGRLESG